MKIYLKAVDAGQLKSLTTLEFIERLAGTPAGRGLMEETARRGEKYVKTFLDDLASKYEDFGKGATEYFKQRAQLVSVVIAIGLAFSLNVNAVHLFKTFLIDKDARRAMIESGEDVAKRMQEHEAELKKLLVTIDSAQKENLEKIEKNVSALRETAHTLSQAGIPIGWDTAPWNSKAWKDYQKAEDWLLRVTGGVWLLLKWVFAVMLAGLLIGLGGPFWFDTFRKLSSLAGIVRGLETPEQKAKEQDVSTSDEPEEKSEIKPKFVVIFETAAKASTFSEVKGRVLLTPDGKIDKGEIL